MRQEAGVSAHNQEPATTAGTMARGGRRRRRSGWARPVSIYEATAPQLLRIACWILFTLVTLAAASSAELAPQLPEEVQQVLSNFEGELYFIARDLDRGRVLAYRPDAPVQTASVIKVAIMVEAFRQVDSGKLDLKSPLQFRESDRVPGAGILQDLSPGLKITLLDAVTLMIVLSDNSATNMVIDRVGMENVNKTLKDLGLERTYLNKKVFRDAPPDLSAERARWGLGVTTPRETAQLLEAIYRRKAASPESCDEMISIMKRNRDREQIPRLLFGPDWKGVSVANKSGALNQVRNDVAIVFTEDGDYILSLFAQESKDQKWTADNAASLTLARLARALLKALR